MTVAAGCVRRGRGRGTARSARATHGAAARLWPPATPLAAAGMLLWGAAAARCMLLVLVLVLLLVLRCAVQLTRAAAAF